MMADAELDACVDGIYRVVKGRVQWDNLIPTAIEVAREVEQLRHLRGKEKLDVLLKTLKFALKESDKTPEEKERILQTIDTVVPLVIQAAILASKIPVKAMAQACCSTCWKK